MGNQIDFFHPLLGGLLIGFSASLLLLFKGKVFGVSGILSGALSPKTGDKAWRIAAILGLAAAGVLARLFFPTEAVTQYPLVRYAVAGLLVGFGTQLGGGCTSGHGICGVSRFSRRSLIATLVFVIFGAVAVAVTRAAGGLP